MPRPSKTSKVAPRDTLGQRVDNVRAAITVRQLALDIADDYNGRKYGWCAHVARELGVSHGCVQLLVNRKVSVLNEPTIRTICKTAGIPRDVLVAP